MKYITILLLTVIACHAQADAPKGWARHVVTAVIIGESGGHGMKGCEAVYEIIHARATKRRSTCLYEVLRDNQFSVINKPMTPALLVRKYRDNYRNTGKAHDKYWEVYKFLGDKPATTHTRKKGEPWCRNYHTESSAPYWSFVTEIDKKTGKRVFVYKVKIVDGKEVKEKIPLDPFAVFGGHKWYNNVK